MPDLIKKALGAKRESKYVEFKHGFNPDSPGEWCEVIKDIVAIANSGGGIIVFGLDSLGTPSGAPLETLARIDPADVTNRISKYTGLVDLEFEIRELVKDGQILLAFVIQPVSIPVVFQKPGTYDIGSGKQKTAFGVGTVYFRHGAKSEPGNTDDIRSAIERQLELIRKSWIKGVRKVVQAPQGSQIIAVEPGGRPGASVPLTNVRAVRDPKATPVLLTRDPRKAVGSFIHEEISEGIFDEINNVVDVNRVLAKSQQHFLLGPSVYYRIYAERHHVSKGDDDLELLFHSAVCDLYAPAVFWALSLPQESVARVFAELYLHPKSPQIHAIMRMAVLLGDEFCKWLYDKWHRKWHNHAQPPTFYFSFAEMISKLSVVDPRVVSARATLSTRFEIAGEQPTQATELLLKPQLAASLLSKACMRVFQGEADMRSTARNLDYFAYGLKLRARATELTRAIKKVIGRQEAGDFIGTMEED